MRISPLRPFCHYMRQKMGLQDKISHRPSLGLGVAGETVLLTFLCADEAFQIPQSIR